MKKYWWIILILVLSVIGGIIFYIYTNNSVSKPNYISKKSGFNSTLDNSTNNVLNMNSTNSLNSTSFQNETNPSVTSNIVEKEIASFSTKITNKKDTNRQGNISITCSTLNNTIVKPNETFSFCDVVGDSTPEKGYKEANVIVQGVETKGLGGRKLPSKFYFV